MLALHVPVARSRSALAETAARPTTWPRPSGADTTTQDAGGSPCGARGRAALPTDPTLGRLPSRHCPDDTPPPAGRRSDSATPTALAPRRAIAGHGQREASNNLGVLVFPHVEHQKMRLGDAAWGPILYAGAPARLGLQQPFFFQADTGVADDDVI